MGAMANGPGDGTLEQLHLLYVGRWEVVRCCGDVWILIGVLIWMFGIVKLVNILLLNYNMNNRDLWGN